MPIPQYVLQLSFGSPRIMDLHEIIDDPMEGATLIAKAFLSRCQCAKVLHSLGNHLAIQTYYNPPDIPSTVLNVKVNL